MFVGLESPHYGKVFIYPQGQGKYLVKQTLCPEWKQRIIAIVKAAFYYLASLLSSKNRIKLNEQLIQAGLKPFQAEIHARFIETHQVLSGNLLAPDKIALDLNKTGYIKIGKSLKKRKHFKQIRHLGIRYFQKQKLNETRGDEYIFKQEKRLALYLLGKDLRNFNSLPPILQKDYDVALKLVTLNGINIRILDESLKKDKKIILAAIKSTIEAAKFIDPLLFDREIFLAILTRNPELTLQQIPQALQEDEEILLALVGKSSNFSSIPERLQTNKEFLVKAVARNPELYKKLSEEFQNDIDIVKAYISRPYSAYAELKPHLKENKQVILAALRTGWVFLKDLSDPHKSDEEIVLAAIDNWPWNYKECAIKDNLKVAEAYIKKGHDLHNVPDHIRNVRRIVLALVGADGDWLNIVSSNFKNDPEVVRAAVLSRPSRLGCAGEKLLNDREFMLEMTQKIGALYVFGGERRYYVEKYRRDKEFIYLAVAQHPSGMKFALGDELRKDVDLACYAVRCYPEAYEFLDWEMKSNERVKAELNKHQTKEVNAETIPEDFMETVLPSADVRKIVAEYLHDPSLLPIINMQDYADKNRVNFKALKASLYALHFLFPNEDDICKKYITSIARMKVGEIMIGAIPFSRKEPDENQCYKLLDEMFDDLNLNDRQAEKWTTDLWQLLMQLRDKR